MLAPPSNGFDSNFTNWTMRSNATGALSIVTDSANSCVGSAYLACDGSKRSKEWDGPSLNVLSYLKQGKVYTATIAARFDPKNAPATAKPLIFSAAVACSNTSVSAVYTNMQKIDTLTTWTRFTGTLPTTLTNCTSISLVSVYVETDASEATYSIDIDDFQLIEL